MKCKSEVDTLFSQYETFKPFCGTKVKKEFRRLTSGQQSFAFVIMYFKVAKYKF